MKSITLRLVKSKTTIENDINLGGVTSRVLAYASIETNEGIVIKDISVRQDVQNPTNIKVVYPFKKLYTDVQPYIEFNSLIVKKETDKMILTKLKDAISKEINVRPN